MPKELKKKINDGNLPITIMVPIEMKFGEEDKSEIQLLKAGEWNHPMYGPVKITDEVQKEFVANFKKNLRAHSSSIGLPIDEEHRSSGGAVGWIKKLTNRGSEGLFAIVEWNSKGRQLIKDAIYRFFSPEFYFQYEDPESRKVYNNVLIGGALTNRPYFKGLNPVVLSEDILINNQNNHMILSEVIKKNLADLSDDEKSFVSSHFAELDEDIKTKFNEIKPQETDEEKKAREDKEAVEAAEKAKVGDVCKMADGSNGKMGMKDGKKVCMSEADFAIQASEKSVSMSEAEVKQLKDDAEIGKKAQADLKKKEMGDKVAALVYSETNKEGKVPATLKEKITDFVMALSEDQVKSFFEIVGGLPSAKLFVELGEAALEGNGAGDAPKGVSQDSFELDKKAKELMASDSKLTYDKALIAAEKELAK